jgi:hypothetical protein
MELLAGKTAAGKKFSPGGSCATEAGTNPPPFMAGRAPTPEAMPLVDEEHGGDDDDTV